MSKSFNTSIEERHGCLWITIKDSIDMDNYRSIEEDIFQQIKDNSSNSVVIDLSKIPALFSSGVGVIMRIHSLSKEHNKDLYLVNANDKVEDVMETMGLDSVLKIYPTEDAFKADQDKS